MTTMQAILVSGSYLLVSEEDLVVYRVDADDTYPSVARFRTIGRITKEELMAAKRALRADI